MAAETVKIYCYDQNSDLVDGVLIRVFDITGATFITSDFTGNVIPGAVEFTLNGGDPIEYTIRMSKIGMCFNGDLGDESKTPQKIGIYSPPTNSPTGTNDFEVYGSIYELPVASDSRVCRCTGRFLDMGGKPIVGMGLYLKGKNYPLIAEGNLISGPVNIKTTDKQGRISVDLFRNGKYSARLTGFEDLYRDIYVPDMPAFNLIHLLFTVVKSVTFTPGSLSLTVDQEQEIDVEIIASDTRILESPALGDVEYIMGDTDIATFASTSTGLIIRGRKAGTTTLTVARKNKAVTFSPPSDIEYTPLTITVT